jgi:hypothetical protein
MHRCYCLALGTAVMALSADGVAAQKRAITIDGTAPNRQVTVGEGMRAADPFPASGSVSVVVRCAPDTHCARVALVDSADGQQRNDTWLRSPGVPSAADSAVWETEVTRLAGANRLVVLFEGARIGGVALPGRAASAPAPRPRVQREATLAGNPIIECGDVHLPRRRNHMRMLVTTNGNVLYASKREITELDSVTVYVRGASTVVPHLRIRRSSAMRDAVAFSVAGAGTKIDLAREALEDDEDAGCSMTHAAVRDFAPGTGVIAVEYLQRAEGGYKAAPMSTFEVPVIPMYHAGLSFGVIRTELANPSYRAEGADSVVTEAGGGRRHLYSVMLTPFVLGRRNVTSSPHPLYQRISPTIGVVLNQVAKNALLGVTVDLPAGTYLTFGGHFGEVTRLSTNSPQVGTPLRGSGRGIATDTRWRSAFFSSFSVDLRAAAELLKAAAGK